MGVVQIRGYWPAVEVVDDHAPSRSEPEQPPPVALAEWLSRDHGQWQPLIATMSDPARPRAQRYRACDELIERVCRHAFAAVTVLYPAVRPMLPAQDVEVTTMLRADLIEATRCMVELEHLIRGDHRRPPERFGTLARSLRRLLEDHVRREESVLPVCGLLDDASVPHLLAALAEAEQHAPSRPHPHTLGHPVAVRLLATIERGIDAMRDTMDGRPTAS